VPWCDENGGSTFCFPLIRTYTENQVSWSGVAEFLKIPENQKHMGPCVYCRMKGYRSCVKKMDAQRGSLQETERGKSLFDGKSVVGAGRLTVKLMFHNVLWFRSGLNTGCVEEIRRTVWSTFLHKVGIRFAGTKRQKQEMRGKNTHTYTHAHTYLARFCRGSNRTSVCRFDWYGTSGRVQTWPIRSPEEKF
jgi:hypothetical protein